LRRWSRRIKAAAETGRDFKDLGRVTVKAALNRLKRRVLRQTSGALRRNCGDRRYFAGFWRFVAVEKTSRSKGLSATGIERRSVRDGFNRRIRQFCEFVSVRGRYAVRGASQNSNAAKHLRTRCVLRMAPTLTRAASLAASMRQAAFAQNVLRPNQGNPKRAHAAEFWAQIRLDSTKASID
jgi:hypothetical protein